MHYTTCELAIQKCIKKNGSIMLIKEQFQLIKACVVFFIVLTIVSICENNILLITVIGKIWEQRNTVCKLEPMLDNGQQWTSWESLHFFSFLDKGMHICLSDCSCFLPHQTLLQLLWFQISATNLMSTMLLARIMVKTKNTQVVINQYYPSSCRLYVSAVK